MTDTAKAIAAFIEGVTGPPPGGYTVGVSQAGSRQEALEQSWELFFDVYLGTCRRLWVVIEGSRDDILIQAIQLELRGQGVYLRAHGHTQSNYTLRFVTDWSNIYTTPEAALAAVKELMTDGRITP